MRISDWSSDVCSSDLDHQVARLRAVRGGAVHRDDAAAFLCADRVGRETLAVVDVVDLDALVLADAGDVEQPAVDRAGSFVVQLGVGDRGAVDLGFEQGQLPGPGPGGGELGRGAWREGVGPLW